MKKNVKGFIALFAALAAVVCIIISFAVPMASVKGTSFKLWGNGNLYLGIIACVLAIVAIVFGFLSKKDADKKGPRKAGIIIGFIAVFVSFLAMALGGLCGILVDYFNNGEKSAIYESLDKEQRDSFDKFYKELVDKYPEK